MTGYYLVVFLGRRDPRSAFRRDRYGHPVGLDPWTETSLLAVHLGPCECGLVARREIDKLQRAHPSTTVVIVRQHIELKKAGVTIAELTVDASGVMDDRKDESPMMTQTNKNTSRALIEALRSGRYKQGWGAFAKVTHFCCSAWHGTSRGSAIG
jgi:hypothetical protein